MITGKRTIELRKRADLEFYSRHLVAALLHVFPADESDDVELQDMVRDVLGQLRVAVLTRHVNKQNPVSIETLRLIQHQLSKTPPKGAQEQLYYRGLMDGLGHEAVHRMIRGAKRLQPLIDIGRACKQGGEDSIGILLDHKQRTGQIISEPKWHRMQAERDGLVRKGNSHSNACRIVARNNDQSWEYLRKRLKNAPKRKLGQ